MIQLTQIGDKNKNRPKCPMPSRNASLKVPHVYLSKILNHRVPQSFFAKVTEDHLFP